MKLTEAKLKEIIKEELEAVLDESQLLDRYLKGKEEEFRQHLRDMGKDPDEVIDTLGPEQANVMRRTLVSNYPRSIKQESLDDILIPAGFKRDVYKYNRPVLHKRHSVRTWSKKPSVNYDSIKFYTEYNILNGLLRYTVRMTGKWKMARQNITIARGEINIPKFFEISLETEEKIRDADARVLSREKEAIEKALEQYK